MRMRISPVLPAMLFVGACGGDTGTGPGEDGDPDLAIASIEVITSTDVMVVGRSVTLAIRARTAGGESVAAPPATWSVSDPGVAEVTDAGVLTGVGEGEAVIVATAEAHEASLTVRVAPDSIPLFTDAPFEGEHGLWNAFDHDLPFWSGFMGQILTWQGTNVPGLEGHDGYDWALPRGTPLFAVGDGVVAFAGRENPWSCPLLGGRDVSAMLVMILHTAPSGERFLTMYLHLDRLDVASGDTVVAGQQIGLSGNTGCSTGPHLHFGVGREFYQRTPVQGQVMVTDPNGWAASQDDPWLLDAGGAASSRLWAAGAAPEFSTLVVVKQRGTGTTDPPVHMHRFTPPPLPPRPQR